MSTTFDSSQRIWYLSNVPVGKPPIHLSDPSVGSQLQDPARRPLSFLPLGKSTAEAFRHRHDSGNAYRI